MHLLVHGLQLVSIFLQLPKLLFQGIQITHGITQGLNHTMTTLPHLMDLPAQLLHLVHLLHHLVTLFLALLLQLLSALQLPLSFDLLLLLFLDFHDAGVHFYEQM